MRERSDQITLGAFLEALQARPPNDPVRYDFCSFVPTKLISYRGYQTAWGNG